MSHNAPNVPRRDFLKTTAAAGLGVGVLGMPSIARARNLNDAVSVAVMGVNSRGGALADSFATSRQRPCQSVVFGA